MSKIEISSEDVNDFNFHPGTAEFEPIEFSTPSSQDELVEGIMKIQDKILMMRTYMEELIVLRDKLGLETMDIEEDKDAEEIMEGQGIIGPGKGHDEEKCDLGFEERLETKENLAKLQSKMVEMMQDVVPKFRDFLSSWIIDESSLNSLEKMDILGLAISFLNKAELGDEQKKSVRNTQG